MIAEEHKELMAYRYLKWYKSRMFSYISQFSFIFNGTLTINLQCKNLEYMTFPVKIKYVNDVFLNREKAKKYGSLRDCNRQ